MTRRDLTFLVCASAVTAATGAGGFTRPAIAGFVTFIALLGAGAPRGGLLIQLTLILALITATAPGAS